MPEHRVFANDLSCAQVPQLCTAFVLLSRLSYQCYSCMSQMLVELFVLLLSRNEVAALRDIDWKEYPATKSSLPLLAQECLQYFSTCIELNTFTRSHNLLIDDEWTVKTLLRLPKNIFTLAIVKYFNSPYNVELMRLEAGYSSPLL